MPTVKNIPNISFTKMKIASPNNNFKTILITFVALVLFSVIAFHEIYRAAFWGSTSDFDNFLANSFLIDSHNDLPFKLYSLNRTDLNIESLPNEYQTDMKRLRKGKVHAQFWSAYIPCQTNFEGGFVQFTLQQIDLIKRLSKLNGMKLATTASEILSNHRKGIFSSLIGIEGGHQIGSGPGSIAVLRMFRDLGVLYMTLTHSCHTTWADSSSHPPVNNGLTDFGKQIVEEMNKIGMMVDISHVSHDVMRDVIKASKAPLFASHSNAFGICNTTRNIPDFILKEMAAGRDGVIMINFWTRIVSCGHTATIEQVADHFDYVAKIAGVKHIGFGADLDGITEIASGLEDVGNYPALLKILFKRGYSKKDLAGFMSGNLLRVLKKTEAIAKAWKN